MPSDLWASSIGHAYQANHITSACEHVRQCMYVYMYVDMHVWAEEHESTVAVLTVVRHLIDR